MLMNMKSRVPPQSASSRPARGTAVIARSQQHSSAALGALAAAVVLAMGAPAAFADSTEPSTSAAPSTVTSISFARVDARVTEKLRERDSNMEWKCKGISMYDCSGELQEAQEQRFEEMGKMFRSLTGGPDTPGNAESQ